MSVIKKSGIGTQSYFQRKCATTVFSSIKFTGKSDFENNVDKMSERAGKALTELYEDLKPKEKYLKFANQSGLEKLEDFIENIGEVLDFAKDRSRYSPRDILSPMKERKLNASMSTTAEIGKTIIKSSIKRSESEKKS